MIVILNPRINIRNNRNREYAITRTLISIISYFNYTSTMLIDGRALAKNIYNSLTKRVARLPFQPVFCDVLVGNDPASIQYVRMKARAAERLGIAFLHAEFPQSISESDLIEEITRLNTTPHLGGLIVQLPLPASCNRDIVLNAIDGRVDVDCLTHTNLNLFYSGKSILLPPTPAAVLAVLDSVLSPDATPHCVVIGQGELVGRPVTYLLKARGWDVIEITTETLCPEQLASKADVIITATGRPGLLTKDWVKEGAIVIDAGTAENAGSIVGDVDSEAVASVASFLSPTPGGVGPVTIAKLLENVVLVAEKL